MATGRKTGGRQKGSLNKITKDVRNLILSSLDEVGGQKYLVQQAKANPAAFLTLIGKCLPKDVNNTHGGPDGGPVTVVGAIKLVPLERA